MSRSHRQPVGAQPSVPVAQAPLPGRMVAPICTTGSPAVFPVMPNAYGLLSRQPQQYIARPIVYPQPLPNVQNRISFVTPMPSTLPRMFVPVAPVPVGLCPSTSDPAKLLEEQRRFEKERNFQMQQDRLKQFTVAGKKGSMNADNLIDSMFGKLHSRKASGNSSSFSSVRTSEFASGEEKKITVMSLNPMSLSSEFSVPKQDIYDDSTAISNLSTIPIKKDAKELDSMMLECSNLSAPSKAVKFNKPSVKEIIPSSSHGTTFISSEKARDWRNIQGLDDVFTLPKQRFPSWCEKEKVHDLYRKVQAIVTKNDAHPPDTSLLFPILMSSGLSRELLGQIWELVNESASGQLTVEEMYAVLALIAIAQAGHPIKMLDILHQLPSSPIPHLSVFSQPSAVPDQNNSVTLAAEGNPTLETSLAHQSNLLPHQVVRPTVISLANQVQPHSKKKETSEVAENVAAWKPFTDSPDDEFDDFKSATPTAINFSLSSPLCDPPALDDDFDDFKQASCVKVPETKLPISSKSNIICVEPAERQGEALKKNLVSPEEDKYSVFRSLQQNDGTNHWGDFTFAPTSNTSDQSLIEKETNCKEIPGNIKHPSVLVTESTDSADFFKPNATNNKSQSEEDDFGDFIHANVPSTPFTTITDFADFSNFKQTECEQLSSPQMDEEFGEFTSSMPVSLKPELGQDFLFRHLKDNISLAESQSVSSLELGTFDGGGGHSGESKSSLSRQGSIPSLDLKSVGLDGTDSEDCFGEIQLSPFVPRNSKSPSPVSNTKGSDDNESSTTSIGFVFQSSLSLTDKYSVIRQEKAKEEDQHISSWIRCLQSCINILKSTKKIFNQMSCSSVCNEVLSSEEGGNYVKNVIEVYKVVCRISFVSKSVGKETEAVRDLIKEADQAWNTICGFFAGSSLMPEETSLDFSSGILQSEPENNKKACGLCLLNVELQSKSFKQEECPKLSYGGRNYHSACANFWVNCVDPLLPALTLPQLL